MVRPSHKPVQSCGIRVLSDDLPPVVDAQRPRELAVRISKNLWGSMADYNSLWFATQGEDGAGELAEVIDSTQGAERSPRHHVRSNLVTCRIIQEAAGRSPQCDGSDNLPEIVDRVRGVASLEHSCRQTGLDLKRIAECEIRHVRLRLSCWGHRWIATLPREPAWSCSQGGSGTLAWFCHTKSPVQL